MSVIVGSGQLRHHFWSPYCADIVIGFDTEEQAALAVVALGEPWKVTPKTKKAVYVAGIADRELARQKLVLGSFGADVKKIDSIKYSVDVGEPFEVRFPVSSGGTLLRVEAPREPELIDHSRQLSLFGEARNG